MTQLKIRKYALNILFICTYVHCTLYIPWFEIETNVNVPKAIIESASVWFYRVRAHFAVCLSVRLGLSISLSVCVRDCLSV